MLRLLPLLLLLASPLAAQETFTAEQRGAVVDILRRALREDPSILREALASLEAAETRDRALAAAQALAAESDALARNPADVVRGNPRGDVTVVEFFDVRCGYCRQLTPAIAELIRRDPQVRLVLKDLPILGPNSVVAARALIAAQRQGKYGELHDALMALTGEVAEPQIRREAERLGLDWARLRRDMDDAAVTARIDANLALARRIGVEGTPAMVIGDRLVGGAVPVAALVQLVSDARAARRP
ncbi:DsbA family protein [Plastoroseomonas arctica]|uniref:DsbA family protein n=1 Tax=Plastoroseomonas arctica TaxID=1509237 RepID=A0AAF1KHQ9_9PROT|nr:DsbA family protein [Plastoroseomonas arctica]MBR0654209.1 DsbA family protein [Plastoroseomonas arctica]